MPEPSQQVLEAAAAAYEERFVPVLFRPWAEAMADAAQIRAGHRVFDVACGTGVLARAAAARVGPGGTVAGLDMNPGMLAVAARLAPAIEWRRGTADALPFENGSFDAVVSQFGLMFFPDREAALREMLRVLSPGGRLAVAVFDDLDRNPPYATLVSIYERRVGKETADALRCPFALGDRNELLSLFAAAGIGSATVTSHERAARFASVRDMVLADVEGWFPLAGFILDEATIEAVVADAASRLAPLVTPDGAVQIQVSVHIVTAAKA